jgi:membrane associated rhomboid family serine protease
MGFQDRDYYRNDPTTAGRRVGSAGPWTVNTWIIVVCVAVYLVNMFTQGQAIVRTPQGDVRIPTDGLLYLWGYFSFETAIQHAQVWRFVTFQFLHDQQSITHIVFNMFGLYFFGPMIESMLGRRRYLAFYLLCGAAGPIAYLLLQYIPVLPMDTQTPLIGASAGVYGVLIAAAVKAPNTWIQLMFPPVPMKLKTLAWCLIGVAAISVFTRTSNAGGEAAHLGGAAMGFYLITHANLLNWAERLVKRKPYMKIAD